MDNRRTFALTAVVGLLSGFFGGLASQWIRLPYTPNGGLRATSLELIDTSGRVAARFGTDNESTTALDIYGKDGQQRLQLGVWADSKPFVLMKERDGKTRMRLLTSNGRASLTFSDERDERLSLGFLTGTPREKLDSVGLWIWDGVGKTSAEIVRIDGSLPQGWISVRRKNGSDWTPQLELKQGSPAGPM